MRSSQFAAHLGFHGFGRFRLCEELARSGEHFLQFPFLNLTNGVDNQSLLQREQPLRTDETRLVQLAAFEVAAVERNRQVVGSGARGDLAED